MPSSNIVLYLQDVGSQVCRAVIRVRTRLEKTKSKEIFVVWMVNSYYVKFKTRFLNTSVINYA